MGCGESKHDVVAGNTISQSKKSNVDDTQNSKGAETIPENATNEGNTSTNVNVKQEENANGNEDSGGGGTVKETKTEDKECEIANSGADILKEKENVEVGDETKEKSEKNDQLKEESIEGIISEGMSGTTVYYSPKHGVSEEKELPNDDVVEEKGSVETLKMDQTKKEDAAVIVKEENVVKEGELVPTIIEAKDSAEGEILSASQEQVMIDETSSKDPKTNSST